MTSDAVTSAGTDRQALLARLLTSSTPVPAARADGPRHVPITGPVPASGAQEALWFVEQLDESPRYNMTMTLRLDGRPDIGALRTCVQALVERHPALRTSFTVIDGHLHQMVHDHVTLPWTCADADTEDLGFVTAHALRPFDLESGPLVRAGLWRFPDSSHVLSLVVHHMVGDGRSFGILLNEIAQHYTYLTAQTGSAPVAPALTFTDFSRDLHERLSSGLEARQRRWWQDHLTPTHSGTTPLPDTGIIDPQETGASHAVTWDLPSGTADLVERFARSAHTTPFTVVMAALQALLCRYGSPDRVTVGTAVDGRGEPAYEHVVGYFVNTVLVRPDIAPDSSFTDHVAATARTHTDALRHSDLPFESVVAAVAPTRDGVRTPLCNVYLVRQDAPGSLRFGDVTAHPVKLGASPAQFDLVVHWADGVDQGAVTLVADGSVLDESTVLDIARHLSNLLTNAVRNPGTPLSELVIVDDVDLDRIRNLTDPASRPSSIAGEHAGITSDFRLVVAEPNGMVCPVGVAGELFLVPVRSVLGHHLGGDAQPHGGYGRLLADGTVRPETRPGTAEVDGASVDLREIRDALVPVSDRVELWPVVSDSGTPSLIVAATPSAGHDHGSLATALQPVLEPLGDSAQSVVIAAPALGKQPPIIDDEALARWRTTLARYGDGLDLRVRSGTELPDDEAAATEAVPSSMLLRGDPIAATCVALPDAVRDRACIDPSAPALRDRDTTWTYGDLVGRIAQIRTTLQDRGIEPGSRVAVLLPHTAEVIATLLAITSLGGVYTCLDAAHPPTRRAHVLGAFRPAMIVSSRAMAPSLTDRPEPVLTLDEIPRTAASGLDKIPSAPVLPDSPAYVLFTSGSTGLPKGVIVTHRSLSTLLSALATVVPLGPDDAMAWITTPSFDMSVPELFLPLTTGACVVVAPPEVSRSPDEFVDLLVREHVTAVQATPTLWRALLDTGRVPAHVRRLVGAEPVPLSVARDLAGGRATAFNLYGPTETTVWSTFAPLHADADLVPIGTPLPGAGSIVLDDALRPVAEGRDGELYLFGAGLASGYLDRPAESAARFIACPWAPTERMYRTGDRARLTPDGRLVCLGRVDNQIKIRGYRLEPGEIEQILEQHPAVARAVVTAAPGLGSTTTLTAFVVPTADAAARAEQHLSALAVADDEAAGTSNSASLQLVSSHTDAVDRLRPVRIDNEMLDHLRSAHDVDLVRGNRVVGLMPDITTLISFIDAAARCLVAGGRIVLSGILDPRGAADTAAARSLLRADADAAAADVLSAVPATSGYPAQELTVAQSLWDRLVDENPALSHAEIMLDPTDRPETAGRYDVVLHTVDGEYAPITHEVTWSTRLELPGASETAISQAGQVALRSVPDARAHRVRAAVDSARNGASVADAVREITVAAGVPTRAQLNDRIASTGRVARFFPGTTPGTLDIVAHDAAVDVCRPGPLPPEPHVPEWLSDDPGRAHHSGLLVPELRAHITATLPGYMVPSAFVLTDALPITPNGKIDRTALTAHKLSTASAGTPTAAGHGEIPAPRPVARMFEDVADAVPTRTALEDDTGARTYARLDAEANALARMLLVRGARAGTIVAVSLPRSADLVVTLLAVAKTGAAHLVVDPVLPVDRRSELLDRARPALLVTSHRKEELLYEGPLLDLDDAAVAGERAAASTERVGDDERGCALTADLPAYSVFTSGSTGRPKQVLLAHHGVILIRETLADRFGDDPSGIRVLQFAAVGFDALIFELAMSILSGGTLVVTNPNALRPGPELAATLADKRISHITLPPSALAVMPEDGVPPATTVILAGEALPLAVAARWGAVRRIFNAYGPSEATVMTTMSRPLDGRGNPSIGAPTVGLCVDVLDERLQSVPDDTDGELYVAGPSVALGYHGAPATTAERFVACPFGPPGSRMYRTGDLVRRSNDEFVFLGRSDTQIQIRGTRVEPGEVEDALTTDPEVATAAVVAVADHSGRPELVAFAVTSTDPAELRSRLARKLPAAMVPDRVYAVSSLPLNANGKIDRAELRSQATASASSPGSSAGPAAVCVIVDDPADAPRIARALTHVTMTDRFGTAVPTEVWTRRDRTSAHERVVIDGGGVEHDVRTVWEEVLGCAVPSQEADFFELGGHSLRAAEVAFRLRDRGHRVNVQDVFEHPTIGRLTLAIRGTAPVVDDADIEADAVLDAAVVPMHGGPRRPARASDPHAVFLTGATGFAGAHILRELLDSTVADVHVLVRARDDSAAERRMHEALAERGLLRETDAARIHAYAGDLGLERFGWDEQCFGAVAERIDAVVHCGADVNLLASYRQMRATNVVGTTEVLRLSAVAGGVAVHHISTTSVVLGMAAHTDVLTEDAPIPTDAVLPTGYVTSKWVAERLALSARERGIPVNMYRLSRVWGPTTTGECNPDDALVTFLRASVEVGAMADALDDADGATDTDLVPADYVAQVVVALLPRVTGTGRTYHVVHPNPVPLKVFGDRLRERGYPLDESTVDEWSDRVAMHAARDGAGGAVRSSSAMRSASADLPTLDGYTVDRRNLDADLAGSGIECPEIDATLLDRYFDQLIDTGVLPPRDRR